MDNGKSIELLRENYYHAIKNLQDKDDIMSSLPEPDYVNFFPIIQFLVEQLTKDYEELQQMLQDPDYAEMKELIQEDLTICASKIELCQKLKEQGSNILQTETLSEKRAKHCIFATTDMGNVCIEKDLKYIPEEYYEDILDCISDIEDGIEEVNPEKARMLRSSAALSGIHEIKRFKVRVMYRMLTPDTAFVIMARMKKDDNALIDRESVIIRKKQLECQYQELKKELESEEKKQEIIEENDIIRDRIVETLTVNQRGGNHER